MRFECTGKLRAEGFVPVSDGAHKYSITDRSLKVGSITLIRVEKLWLKVYTDLYKSNVWKGHLIDKNRNY